MSDSIQGATVLITGGTGTFGNAFLDKCIEDGAKEVRIFSRDEKKQYDMAQRYRNHNVRFFLGDIRDKRTIDAAMGGVDYVFHAAAMKQVPSCERFPLEAVKTNITGSDNLLASAIGKRVKKVVCLSTDKAVYPTSAMGMTKAYMEKLAIQKAYEQDRTKICVTRFGNLVASRGSAVPLFIEQVQNGMPITITDPDMTRFLMTVNEAVDLVAKAFRMGDNGELLVKKSSACTTGDLAKAVCRFLDLPADYPTEIIGIRAGEKMHEALLTEEEAEMAVVKGDYIVVSRKRDSVGRLNAQYKSDLAPRMAEEEVLNLIRSVFEGGAR
ncbi:MAG: SDR family NAD(P)-dependent oxidoreductase [Oscillospiraceae bacterium]|nr:SDR family NAD(P)-dependent oxidoreductase [Oscillospiraceae bacterium]